MSETSIPGREREREIVQEICGECSAVVVIL